MSTQIVVLGILIASGMGGIAKEDEGVNVESFNQRGIMMYGDRSLGGEPFAKDPSVVRFKGKYWMYYSVPTHDGNNGWKVGIASSQDMLRWKKEAQMESEHPSEEKGFCAPAALVWKGKIHLFYQSYGNKEKDAICHAWSDDGVHFTREPSNPIFRPHGKWTCGRAIDAEVVPDGKRMLLYFASRDPGYEVQLMGVAAAPIDSDFSRGTWTQLVDAPILKPELPWEKKCLEAASVLRRGKKLFMFYAGAFNNEPQQIGVATSEDGVKWKRMSDQPFLTNGKAGDWNESESGHPGIFQDEDGQTYLFYQGNKDGGKSWYLSKVKIGWKDGKPFVDKKIETAMPLPSAEDRAKDARPAWWREARFGMFIHWGVYSAFGGEWNGQKVEGYAEHLQRIMKIKREEYLEKVVKPFNPTEFSADEWVETAKDTGMQYIVITSMHHDGVAMFDSKTDDYNVVKTSKFGRDPLKELKEACDKYGVKLGFYYSHAQDWSTSGDPRYPEPNGPERRKAVVEKKVFPQIKELIENYHPALFWGDTPHHNPKELNEAILAYLREQDPSLIINGRVAGAIYGDYLSTPDRPLEFGPMTKPEEKDWEAIPTTNESYGYHSLDKSHKSPAHFIRLLAKAAAKGGNLLLNIGPMGNGKMAPEDLSILHAIGKWWAVNGESIRGTTRTPLMRQSWGDSTLKGKNLYLHVFDWPKDGKLVVGGIKGEIEKAFLLADRKKVLKVERKELDVEIELPEKALDEADTVILVECMKVPQGDPVFLLQNNTPNRLSVFFADLLGAQKKDGWRLGRGTATTANVTGWSQKECGVQWSARLNQKTCFDVVVRYDAPGADGKAKVETMGGTITKKSEDTFGGTFVVEIGNQKLKGEVIQQGEGVELNLGQVTLERGSVQIQVMTDTITGKELMRLQSVTLIPQ